MGHEVPENCIENSFFTTLDIGSSSDWVVEKTGIKSRYSVLTPNLIRSLRSGKYQYLELKKKGKIRTLADLSLKPWKTAISVGQKENYDPPLLICGTSTPDYDIPANASSIAKHLEVGSTCFDVQSACSSFMSGMQVATSLIQSGFYSSASLFNVERYSTRLDYTDKRSCILFGDGATCTIFETGENLNGFEILDICLESDGSGADSVKIPYGETFYQNGSAVQKFAITKTCYITNKIMDRNQLGPKDIQYFVGHQANLRMLQSSVKKLNFSNEQHLYNVDLFGNQGGAGAPSVLAQNWHKFRDGDMVIATVVGSGLTWGSCLLKFHG